MTENFLLQMEHSNGPFYSTLLFIIWDVFLSFAILILWCMVMGNQGIAFMAVPQARSVVIPTNGTVSIQYTNFLMHYKYFSMFLILVVIVDLIIFYVLPDS